MSESETKTKVPSNGESEGESESSGSSNSNNGEKVLARFERLQIEKEDFENIAHDPFENFIISPQDHLIDLERTFCEKCKSYRKYFCYLCLKPLGPLELVPRIPLPLRVDVLHHPKELLSKSTAVHSKLLSPDFVSIIEYPDIPDYKPEETILLYPTEDSIPVSELDLTKIKKVVFIDSQWHNAKKILKDPKLQSIQRVRIDSQKTLFWRYQKQEDDYLATIEAIYYFFREFGEKHESPYQGQYDNLLYYYSFLYRLIQGYYRKNKHILFNKKENYIKYD